MGVATELLDEAPQRESVNTANGRGRANGKRHRVGGVWRASGIIAMSVHSRRRDESGEPRQWLELRESQLGATIRPRAGESIGEPGIVRCE